MSIVILDACRNNPYARSFRSTARGLAQMTAATGSLIAFATAPGSTAADGAGRNGIYTKHLLTSLQQQDSDILKVFQRTRAAVVKETGGKQTPWESTSLVGDFYFALGAPATAAGADVQTELAFWESMKDSKSADEINAYLEQYPNGRFAGLARARLKALQSPPQQVALAPSSTSSIPTSTNLAATQGDSTRQAQIDSFKKAIRDKIRRFILLPEDIQGNPEVEFQVILLPGGNQFAINLAQSSGNTAYDNAVQRGIRNAGRLPVPPDPTMFKDFKELHLKFRPSEDLAVTPVEVVRQAQIAKIRKAISDKIRSFVKLPSGIQGNPEAQFDVVLLPDGNLLGVKLKQSSGNIAYDSAIERAIFDAGPLPLSPDPTMFKEFRELNLKFRPRG